MIKNLLLTLFVFSVTTSIWAQNRQVATEPVKEYVRCFTNEAEASLRANNPDIPSMQEFENWMAQKIEEKKNSGESQRATYTIPYVVHVIHNGDQIGTGDNISTAKINAQIQQINDDFQRMNGDAGNTPAAFTGIAGSIDLEFKPAVIDENGSLLAEPGINRIDRNTVGWTAPPYGGNNCNTVGFDDSYIQGTIKPNSSWDPTKYFNIWLMDLSCGILGYAQFPNNSGLGGLNANGGGASTDGVVFLGSSVGSLTNPGSTAPYNLGRTATHEIGHWLGLRHVWGDGPGCADNGAAANCACGNDDFCDDTPNAGRANYSCTNGSTCGSVDMKENYMDYTSDVCMNLFTQDQITRVETVLANSPRRNELLTSNVWENPSNVITAKFSFDTNGECNPVAASFTDESTAGGGVDPINSWSWNFDKNNVGTATPATFSGQNPGSVTFSQSGSYTVELTVGNGTLTSTYSVTINVADLIQKDHLNNGALVALGSGGDNPFGFIGGHNNYGDIVKAEYFNDLTNGETLESADFYFHTVVGNPASSVKFNIYNNAGAMGQPGAIISTQTITIGDLVENDWTTVDFPDIVIAGPIYIGCEFAYLAGDTLAIATNSNGETVPTTAWEQWSDNDWYPFNDGTMTETTWELDVALAIKANFACPVPEAPPVADFESDNQSVCSGVDVQFTDLSTNVPSSWSWTFGDGGTSTAQNPTHSYATGGNYTVTLVATNAEGSGTETKMNYISVQTEPANFQGNASTTEICVGESVNLSMSGTFGAVYSWEVNGNVVANGASTSVSPTTTTTYTAICDNGICRVTDEVIITVNPLPDAPTITANAAVLTSSAGTTYQWSDANGEISGATMMTYTASASGTFTVEITDANGCANESAPFMLSLDPPVAAFSADVTTVCEGGEVTFTDASTNSPTSWSWDFGDNSAASTMQNPTHTYATAGMYTVTLTAINDFGDDDEVKMNYITVQAQPTGFAGNADVETICPGADVSLSMSGTFSASYSWWIGSTQVATGSSTTVNPTVTTTYTALCDNGVCSAEDDVVITVRDLPAAPTITNNSPELSASGTGTFQWYLNGTEITGATSADYSATEDGNYTVTTTDANGCTSNQSAIATVANTAVIDETLNAAITMYPNPVTNVLNIQFSNNSLGKLSLDLVDVTGRLIHSEAVKIANIQVDMSSLAKGVYIVKITNEEGGIAVREIVKK